MNLEIAEQFSSHVRVAVITARYTYEGRIVEYYDTHMVMRLINDPELNYVTIFYSAIIAIEFKG